MDLGSNEIGAAALVSASAGETGARLALRSSGLNGYFPVSRFAIAAGVLAGW
jgi:hypothetical protein